MKNILLLGESAGGSAEYLKNCFNHLNYNYTHIGSKESIKSIDKIYDIIIISDYPAEKLDKFNSSIIINQIKQGSRFIMVGGWSSFNGRGKSYYNHPIAKLLPVILTRKDDRKNFHQGLILFPCEKIRTAIKLDWNRPPLICGFNNAKPKSKSEVLVYMKPIITDGNKIIINKPIPLVIKNFYEKGASIACLTDLTPHWCGGLVDWGNKRITCGAIEIGDMYLNFIKLLLEY